MALTIIVVLRKYYCVVKNHLEYLKQGGTFIILWPDYKEITIENYGGSNQQNGGMNGGMNGGIGGGLGGGLGWSNVCSVLSAWVV